MTVKEAEAIISRLEGNRTLYRGGRYIRAVERAQIPTTGLSAFDADMILSSLNHETPGERIDRIRAHFAEKSTGPRVVRCAS